MKYGSYSELEYRDFLDFHSQPSQCCFPETKENKSINIIWSEAMELKCKNMVDYHQCLFLSQTSS